MSELFVVSNRVAGRRGVCAAVALAWLCAGAAHAATSHMLAGGGRPTLATVTETVTNGRAVLTGGLSLPGDAGGVLSGTGTSTASKNLNAEISPLPASQTASYNSTKDATSAIGDIVTYGMTMFVKQAAAAMTTGSLKGAQQMVFTYGVSVTIQPPSGQQQKGYVTDTCFIAPSAQSQCLGAQYGSDTSYTLFAVYSQGAVADGLPSSWTMPYPGVLQWSMLLVQGAGTALTQSLVPIDGEIWHNIDLLRQSGPIGQYGLYDELQVATVTVNAVKQQVLVNCGAVSNGECSQYQSGASVPDPDDSTGTGGVGFDPRLPVSVLGSQLLAPLENQYGANNAVLLYGTTVQPVYDAQSDGTQAARTAVNISERVVIAGKRYFFITNGGQAHFNETGAYGFLLDQNVDEYKVDAEGTPSYISSFDQHQVSPTQNFSKSVTLSQGQTVSGPTIINPFPTGDELYSYLDDTVNHLPASDYVYVAPITNQK